VVKVVHVVNKNDWRTEVNILRETWVFTYIQTNRSNGEQKGGRVEYIETGVGNSNRLLRKEQYEIEDHETESQLLKIYKTYVDELKKDAKALITPDLDTLRILRTRLLEHDITVSFRGLMHIPLREVYTEHFTYSDKDIQFDSYQDIEGSEIADGGTAVERMWDAYKTAGPYLPLEDLRGREM
jgi:hypothetical protein